MTEKLRKYHRNWKREYRKNNPWMSHYYHAKERCENPNCLEYIRYGAKGRIFSLTIKEIKELWFRDEAYLFKRPNLDRINNDKDYTFNNCQFLEHNIHALKTAELRKTKINQYSLNGDFIKKWNSQSEIAKYLKISNGDISNCVNGKKIKTVKGFIWKKV